MIRKIDKNDLLKIVDLCKMMYEEGANHKRLSFSPERVLEVVATTVETGYISVIEQGEELVGIMAGCLVQPAFSRDFMACDYMLYVVPKCRGGMTAIRLVRDYIKWAKEGGAKLITVGVTAGIDNDFAVKFYEALGFKQTGNLMMMEV